MQKHTLYLEKERPGFSGLNHVLIAIMLFLILLMIPVEPFSSFLHGMISNPIIGVMAFLVICGGAELPDMDNLKSDGGSAASWDLGIIGSIISSIMVTISSVMTTIFHGKRDVRPYTQHRFFWHTLFVPAVMYLLVRFFVPDTQTKTIDVLKTTSATNIPTATIVSLFMVAITIYCGAIMLLKKLSKLSIFPIKAGSIASILMLLGVVICVFSSTEHTLKLLMYCVCLGYLFHLIGDMFADGGIPALFPISGIWGKFWQRVKLIPLTVTTGSTIESLLKIVFATIDCVLAYYVFLR